MNLHKLEIALKVIELRSISKAAGALFLSQPTVSESIHSIETELGIKLFRRTSHGMELTADGLSFESYARTIIYNAALMKNIGKKSEHFEIHLSAPKIDAVDSCFVRFCEKHADSEYIHATLETRSFSLTDAEDSLSRGECDIAIASSTPSIYSAAKKKLKENGISSVLLLTLPLFLITSVNHPLASVGFVPDELGKYICIHSSDPSEFTPFIQPEITAAVSWNRVIRIENRDTRLKLISTSAGYEVGLPVPEEVMTGYHLKASPIPDAEFSLICLCRSSRLEDANIRELYQMILDLYTVPGE